MAIQLKQNTNMHNSKKLHTTQDGKKSLPNEASVWILFLLTNMLQNKQTTESEKKTNSSYNQHLKFGKSNNILPRNHSLSWEPKRSKLQKPFPPIH